MNTIRLLVVLLVVGVSGCSSIQITGSAYLDQTNQVRSEGFRLEGKIIL